MPVAIASPVYFLGSWAGNVVDDNSVEWVVTKEEGWSSSPPVRPTIGNRAASDGAWGGPGFYGARVVNLSGRAKASSRVGMLAAKDRIKAAIGVRDPATLTVQEAHLTRIASVRLADQIELVDVTDQIFDWSLTVVATDPRRYSQFATTVTAILPVGLTSGRTYARTYPLVYGGAATGGSGSVFVSNDGDFDQAPAVITFFGPLISPRVEHHETDRNLTFDLTLAYDEKLVVDLKRLTVLLNGSANRAYTISAGSAWFMLQPGVNELAFRGMVGPLPSGIPSAPDPQMVVVASSAWT